MSDRSRPPGSPSLAGFLSFLWPGLGQAWQGRRRSALLWALPPLAVIALVVVAAADGFVGFAAELLTPSVAITVFGLLVLLGLWRILAIVDAARFGVRRVGAGTAAVVGVLVLATVAMHGVPAFYAFSVYDAGTRIFVAQSPVSTPSPDGTTASPGVTDDPNDMDATNADDFVARPEATPASKESRINVLVTGIDSGPTRSHALTDTLLVVSIDPLTKQVALVSFPRDIADFPLWDGRTFRGKINSLMSYARRHPDEFPDGAFPTLIKELGYLLGAPIHYYAAIDLNGFVRMIDLVGGVTVDNRRAINDPAYDWIDGSRPGFFLSAGKHKLDGKTALAYARSRQGVGDSDFTRARRQQEILLALRQKLVRPENVARIPALLEAAGDSVRTNFPQDRVGEMVELAQGVSADGVRQYVLGPPYAQRPPAGQSGGTYKLWLDMDRLAALSIKLFGDESRYAR